MNDDITIGERIKQARKARALSREQLAERSGVSMSLITKLEAGQRDMARITTLTALSMALGIELPELLGKQERLGPGRGIIELRDALLTVDHLPGIDPAYDTGDATPADQLADQVKDGWRRYWDGQFGELSAMLPGLLGEARVTARADGEDASRLLAEVYQLAASVCAQVAHPGLGYAAAAQGARVAQKGGDSRLEAMLLGTAAWVLMHMGRHGEARAVASQAAAGIEPRMSEASPEHLTAWGSLLLTAAAAAAGEGNAGAVRDLITMARAAAYVTRDGKPVFAADRHDYHTNFGRTQVEMQACYTATQLGQPGDALRAATRVRRDDLLPISWGAHNLDVAHASLQARRPEAAIGALTRAHAVSAEWFRHQSNVRPMVREVLHAETRRNPALRAIARTVGMK